MPYLAIFQPIALLPLTFIVRVYAPGEPTDGPYVFWTVAQESPPGGLEFSGALRGNDLPLVPISRAIAVEARRLGYQSAQWVRRNRGVERVARVK